MALLLRNLVFPSYANTHASDETQPARCLFFLFLWLSLTSIVTSSIFHTVYFIYFCKGKRKIPD